MIFLNNKTHYSTKALTKISHLAEHPVVGLCDIGCLSGTVEADKKCEHPLYGMEVRIDSSQLLLFAKNKRGWYTLCELCGIANTNKVDCDEAYISDEVFYDTVTDDVLIIYLWPVDNPRPGSYMGIMDNRAIHVMREHAEKHNLPAVCVHETLFPEKKDLEDFHLILSIAQKRPLSDIYIDDFQDSYFLSEEELLGLGYRQEELDNTKLVAEECERFSLAEDPIIPKIYDDPDAVLKEVIERRLEEFPELAERAWTEYEVITKYKLSNYLLIISDIIEWVSNTYALSGVRGSASGSLLCYFLGITNFNPVEHGLIFERFINAGRMSEDRVQLPDIDIDVPSEYRDEILQYITDKYGAENTCQILTLSTIKSAAALKAVFRARGFGFSEINSLTKKIIPEHKISDVLSQYKKEGKPESAIYFALENFPNEFMEYCHLDDNGEVVGEHAEVFKQAMRLEGTIIARGKHAAGVIIAPEPIYKIAPTILDEQTGKLVTGLSHTDAEYTGLTKFDLLGLATFSKIIDISEQLYVENLS